MKNQWRVILGLVLVLLVVLFAVFNNQNVPVNFGFVKISGPLILIILGSAILGALIGLLASTTTIWKQKKQVKELEKTVDSYKNKTNELAEEEVAKVKRQYENKLAELQAKYEAEATTTVEVTEEEPVGNRVEHFTKPRNEEE